MSSIETTLRTQILRISVAAEADSITPELVASTMDLLRRYSAEELGENTIKYEIVQGKNLFNKNESRSYVTESQSSSTGYVFTDSEGNTEEFTNATSSATRLTDTYPDENIYGAYFHRYFGWIYDSTLFTSHKIKLTEDAITATFFNGGTEKTILAFDASGNYLGHVVTSSSDWAHVTMLASDFSGVSYIRLSSCVISADPNVLQAEYGEEYTSYEAYVNSRKIPEEYLPSDIVYEDGLRGKETNRNAAQTLISGAISIVRGHYDSKNRPIVGSGSIYISDYVDIFGGLVYEFEYVNACHFYDANHEEIEGTVLSSGFSYQAPLNAKYMSVQFNGIDTIPFASTLAEDYVAEERTSNLNNLVQNEERRVQLVNTRTHKSSYTIGDSEAARFHQYVDEVKVGKIVSSFGGHTTDLIATNVGQGTGGIGSLTHLKGCNVVIVSGTNDQSAGQDARLIAYHRELIHNLRAAGANEIFALSPFWDITKDPEEMRASAFVANLKRLYGGHYIDVMEHILDCGVYYCPYHPAAFTQPAVGSSVDISFEDVDALVECGLMIVGFQFWIRYYDDKADLYECTAYDTTNNTVTATLVTNGSDVAPGSTAGQYNESVSTSAWSGTKTTLGWVYNSEDGERIANGQIPACIYSDRSVHFGKIMARIIEDMLGLYYDMVG